MAVPQKADYFGRCEETKVRIRVRFSSLGATMPESCNHQNRNDPRQVLRTLAVLAAFISATSSNTAASRKISLSPLEQELVAEINTLRRDPPAYAAMLSARKPFYRGVRVVAAPDNDQNVEVTVESTKEGLPALEEAVAVLRSTHRRARLQLSKRLCRAAGDHLLKQGVAGTMGHPDPDGEAPLARVKSYMPSVRVVGENLSYGRWTAKDVVFHELVDDGVPDRGHRKDLLDPGFESIGVACGYHSVYGIMCVIDLAAEF
jgi:uncharacterized protein YkwD